MKIVITEPLDYSPAALEAYRSMGSVFLGPFTREQLLEELSDANVLVVRLGHKIDRRVLDRAGKLEMIVTPTTGLNHIDCTVAADRGIRILSLREHREFLRTVRATAEHTWALLLALIRRLPSSFDSVRRGEWNRDAFRGNELAGKVLGIVGMGRVGSQVAEFGRAFRMSVVAFDPLLDDWAPDVGRARSIEDLVRRAEVVSIHLLLDDATKGLFGRGVISAMRRGSWLVNTSRGEIVNELALAESLARGHLAGAAVDVLADEHDGERRGSSPLLDYARQHDNLIITPHVAGATVESMRRTEEFMAQQVLELHGRASGPREGSR